jgi:molybdate transport system ATP-binding protein
MGLSVRIYKRLDGFTLDAAWEIGDELAVLFGHSGAGKSLTLRMIAGLMRPDAGMVQAKGSLLFDSGSGVDLPPQKRSFGYVFQHLALFPHMTVLQNILYGGHGIDNDERADRAREMIEWFRLTGLELKYPGQISGGQQQRVAFARALLRRPDALLLDEPFSALDAPLRMEMRGLLKVVQREFGIPVVLVTHDITEAAELADQIIVYVGGRVVQSGTFEQLLARPGGPEVERLLAGYDHALFGR